MYSLPNSVEMSLIDQEAQDQYGIPALLLMENAARGLYEGLCTLLLEAGEQPSRARVLFVAGPGNNGGDAAALARLWHCLGAASPTVLLAAEPRSGSALAVHVSILRRLGVELVQGEAAQIALQSADWVVDGLFGTGLRGELRADAAALITAMNNAPGRRVALDIPSGVSDDFQGDRPAVKAYATLAVELPKLCYYTESARPLCGLVRTVPLGFPPALIAPALQGRQSALVPPRAVLLDAADLPSFAPRLDAFAHKYSRGALQVYAGSAEYPGAAVLSCNAALHSGAGYVQLHTESQAVPRMVGLDPAVVVQHTELELSPGAGRGFRCCLIGPGWGRGTGRAELLEQLLASLEPGVLDADGLCALSSLLEARRQASDSLTAPSEETLLRLDGWVLTPHHREFERLGFGPVPADAEARRRVLGLCAAELGAVVVLKGPLSWIASPDGRCAVYDGADAFLAAAGSGDVLAGCIASFRAAGLEPFEAACGGVLALGLAAKEARARYGVFSAGELPVCLGAVVARVQGSFPAQGSEVQP